MADGLINNSYKNDKACGSPENFRKWQLSHILDTAPTHFTEYNGQKGFAQKNINTNNISANDQTVKNVYERVARVTWDVDVQRSSPYACSRESYRQ